MRETRRRFIAAVGASLAVAGCQDDGGGSTPTETAPSSGDGATVTSIDHDDLGEILADGDGNVLYMFDSDTQGADASTCTDACLDTWPPLTTDGEPSAGDGVTAELTTFERSDGDTQVAADGWPLYYFASDQSPGDANGQGVNDIWWVLGPRGRPIRSSSGGTDTPTPTEDDEGRIY